MFDSFSLLKNVRRYLKINEAIWSRIHVEPGTESCRHGIRNLQPILWSVTSRQIEWPFHGCLELLFNPTINLFIQNAHRRRTHSGAPQGFGHILNASHRYSGKIHFNQRFFYRTSPAHISFDNCRFKGQILQLGEHEFHLSYLKAWAGFVFLSLKSE